MLLLLMQLPFTSERNRNGEMAIRVTTQAQLDLSLVSGRRHDALAEALRLFALKNLALKYGIMQFDVRNPMQLRSVVNIIMSHSNISGSISDALMFARSWSGAFLSPTLLLIRALFHRATDFQVLDNEKRRVNLESVLTLAQEGNFLKTVVEDGISSLQTYYDQLLLKEQRKTRKAVVFTEYGDTSSIRELLTSISYSLVCIAAYYIDVSGELPPPAASTRGKTFVNDAYLSGLKTISILQSEFGVCLSLAQLSDNSICKSVVYNLANDFIAQLLGSGNSMIGSIAAVFINPHVRRGCALLRVSTLCFLSALVNEMLGSGVSDAIVSPLKPTLMIYPMIFCRIYRWMCSRLCVLK